MEKNLFLKIKTSEKQSIIFSSTGLCWTWIYQMKEVIHINWYIYSVIYRLLRGLPRSSVVKNPPAHARDAEDMGSTPEGWISRGNLQEDFLEKEMTTHSGILAWKIPWAEELGGLHYLQLQRVEHKWAL